MMNEPGLRLSPRELQVLRLIARGLSSPAIADELGIRPHTVRNHIRSMRLKLGARDKLGAVVAGLKTGILAIDDLQKA